MLPPQAIRRAGLRKRPGKSHAEPRSRGGCSRSCKKRRAGNVSSRAKRTATRLGCGRGLPRAGSSMCASGSKRNFVRFALSVTAFQRLVNSIRYRYSGVLFAYRRMRNSAHFVRFITAFHYFVFFVVKILRRTSSATRKGFRLRHCPFARHWTRRRLRAPHSQPQALPSRCTLCIITNSAFRITNSLPPAPP